ncbi:MAG TPA: hypothetical protein VHO02_02575 [Fibrobacteria bacterium]|jgi:hypothetical protein|nr:hypothetical protein [Fibrobacteria bacterium]
MPHRGSISKIFAAGLLCAGSLALPAIARDDESARLRAGLDCVYRMDYPGAEKILSEADSTPSAALVYYGGVAALNRFLDLGDTAALRRAERRFEKLSPRGDPSPALRGEDPERVRLYRGLAGFQLSYLASLCGQTFRSATLAFAARERLLSPAPLKAPEARASLMLYDYYRGRLLEHLPFVGAPEFPVTTFAKAADAAPAMREMLLFSLFWIHMDAKRFDSAAGVMGDFLSHYPDNRLARELRGVLLYRRGSLVEARGEHEKLREEYAELAKAPGRIPLGYYRAVGNLTRIRAALGDKQGATALRAEWNRGLEGPAGPWLPSVLKDDISRL